MTQYGNAFQRAANRPFKFTANWRTPDGEHLQVSGILANIAGGRLWVTRDATATLLGGKPAHRTPPSITGNSLGDLQDKLERTFSRVVISRERDPLKAAIAHDRSVRNRSSAYTEKRTIRREPALAKPAEKLIFGLKLGDPALARIVRAACIDWARQHADLFELDRAAMSDGARALAIERGQANLRSVARLLEQWALTGKISCCTAQEVEDAHAWLEQRHYWQPIQRKRGQSMGWEYFPEPEPTEPAQSEFNPRTAPFEELKKRVLAERRRTMARKNLKGDEYVK